MKNKLTTNYQLLTTNLKGGLTLVELLIAFSIIGLVSILVAAVYFAHSRLFSNQNTSIDVASQNRLALDEMTNQIREAQTILQGCPPCQPPETTSTSVLILQIWPIDLNGEPFQPTWPNLGDVIIYKKNSDKLIKKIIPGAGSSREAGEEIIATGISDLQFTYDNADYTLSSEMSISLTTSANSGGKTITSTQTSKAVLRNK